MILWWLVPAVVATLAAMVYVGLSGRKEQRRIRGRSEADQAKLAAAMQRPHPRRATVQAMPPRPDDRSTGVAVRRRA